MISAGGAAAHSFDDRFFPVTDGVKLHFRDYPGSAERPPLLCLPALTRNARDFAAFATRHSPRFRVIVLNNRGRGESDYDPQPERYSPPTYAGDVLQLLDHLAIDRAIFVGTSLGGLVTMIVAALMPQRIAAAILNDVGPELEEAGLARIRTYVGKDRRFGDWDEAARALAATAAGLPRHYSHADWVRAAQNRAREQNGEIRLDYDMAIGHPFEAAGPTGQVDLWPAFRVLAERPLLIIRGGESDLISTTGAARMREAAPGAQFVEAAGVGHAPDLDEPEVISAVETFLDDFDRR